MTDDADQCLPPLEVGGFTAMSSEIPPPRIDGERWRSQHWSR